jgi:hypothetical protein
MSTCRLLYCTLMAAKQLSVKTLALNEHKLDLGELYLSLTFNTLATSFYSKLLQNCSMN